MSIAGSQDLLDQFELTKDQAAFGLNEYSITGTLISDKCPIGESIFCHSINHVHILKGGTVILTGRGEWRMDPATTWIILYGEVRSVHCHHHCHHCLHHCQPLTPPSSGSCFQSTVTACGRARSVLSRAPSCPPPGWSVLQMRNE